MLGALGVDGQVGVAGEQVDQACEQYSAITAEKIGRIQRIGLR